MDLKLDLHRNQHISIISIFQRANVRPYPRLHTTMQPSPRTLHLLEQILYLTLQKAMCPKVKNELYTCMYKSDNFYISASDYPQQPEVKHASATAALYWKHILYLDLIKIVI